MENTSLVRNINFNRTVLISGPRSVRKYNNSVTTMPVPLSIYTVCLTFGWILSYQGCHSLNWDRVPRWADVYVRGPQGFQDLGSKLEFLMDNYDIVSLEKCLHQTDEKTEDMFLNLTSQMRELRPESNTKILFYWHLTQTYDCYQANEDFLARPDLWLYDNRGYPVTISNSVHWDSRFPEARELWSEGDHGLY